MRWGDKHLLLTIELRGRRRKFFLGPSVSAANLLPRGSSLYTTMVRLCVLCVPSIVNEWNSLRKKSAVFCFVVCFFCVFRSLIGIIPFRGHPYSLHVAKMQAVKSFGVFFFFFLFFLSFFPSLFLSFLTTQPSTFARNSMCL